MSSQKIKFGDKEVDSVDLSKIENGSGKLMIQHINIYVGI